MIQLRSAARGRLQLGRGAFLARHRLLGLVGAALLVAACAASPGPEAKILRGVSGPVSWEITDIGQLVSATGQGLRWSYAIVLKETRGTAISFERVEIGSYASRGETIGGTPVSRPFGRTLAANGELRYSTSESWQWMSQAGPRTTFGGAAILPSKIVEYRFIGKTGGGEPVGALVRIELDRGVGKVVKPLPTTGTLPPARVVGTGDLASLAGSWRGSYRADQGDFDIPLQVVIEPNGSFGAGENDPVTVRSRGTLAIREGRIACSWGRDTGVLALHEGEGKRIVVGQMSGPRDGPPGAPSSTFRYTVRLEIQPR